MSVKNVKFVPLCEMGEGSAIIAPEGVDITVKGINGALKAWLVGNGSVPLGNLVDGRLHKKTDTAKHTGVLITQSGRQIMIAEYNKNNETVNPPLPFSTYGLNWKKIVDLKFGTQNAVIKFLLSSRRMLQCFQKHRHYYIGTGEGTCALAIPVWDCRNNPLEQMGEMKIASNGYDMVFVNERDNRIYIPENQPI